ncbi:hypothetical protein C0995_012400 [Termitomyces sp. Mi166|nr:hypothetical protein C0995_012400 [Termitomyces sp. Mi166\
MLGLTGFECTPSYIGRIKKGYYPLVLRNLHLPAIALNSILMVLVLAIIPLEIILQGANVLSVLAQMTAGQGLRTWIVIDATIVLCGGILSACELLEQLALHRVLPRFFLLKLPITQSLYVSVLSFIAFCGVLYASAGANLSVVSQMISPPVLTETVNRFSLVWLTVMSLFPLTLLLLKFNRGRISRDPNTHLLIIFSSIIISIFVFVGNIAVNPTTASTAAIFKATQNKIHLLRWVYWIYDQYPYLHSLTLAETARDKLVDLMIHLKRQPVCILVKTGEV